VSQATVQVQWVKDGHERFWIADRYWQPGQGPRYRRRMTPAGEVAELEHEGDVQDLPEGVAEVLERAGYVARMPEV
jgi:hypothetical protein